MFGSAIKKSFFDLWDNLFFALAVNMVYTLAVLGLFSLSFLFQSWGGVGLMLYTPVPFLVAALLGGLASFWAKDIAFDGAGHWAEIGAKWSSSWKASLTFGIAWLVLSAGFLFGIPFYNQVHPWAGFVFGVILSWMTFFAAGMSLYYPSLNAQIEPNVRKLVRKSFLVFLANPATSLGLAVGFVVCVALSVVTLGFFPGILGTILWLQVGFKFLMLKYDWMESHPEAKAKDVPWKELLTEDMERVGPRSLRNMIFPWKD